jgi:T5SS/PEP-CTERM-associated repeat protein/autotransporter-associated beta strand protein
VTIGSTSFSGSGVGTLNIGGTATGPAAAGGILNAATVTTGAGMGTVQFNTISGSGNRYFFTNNGLSAGTAISITGPTKVVNTAGYNVLSGTNANSYSGPTTINGGTLADGGPNAFSPNSPVSVNSGAILSVNYNEVTGGLDGSGTANVANGTTLAISNAGSDAFSGVIAGAGALSKTGAGTEILSGVNTYTGGTSILNGTLADGAANAFSPNSPMTVNSGAILGVNFNEVIGGLDASGAANIANGATLAINNAGSDTFSGVITGAGALSKTGAGTETLTGVNSFAGGTTIANGMLVVANGSSINHPAAAITVGASNGDNGTLAITTGGHVTSSFGLIGNSAGSSGMVTVDGGGSSFNASVGVIVGEVGTGTLSLTNGGALNVVGGSGNVILGAVTGGIGTLNVGAQSGGAAAPWGNLNAASVITGAGSGTLQFNTTATDSLPYYFTQNGASGGQAIVIAGRTQVTNTAGYTVLSGANTYTGSTTIAGGTLSVSSLADGGAASGIGTATSAATNLVLSGGGTLQYTGTGGFTDRLFSIGTGAGGAIDSSGTGAVSFTNTGSMGFVSSGARTLTLTGTNTGDNTLAAAIGDNGGATSLIKSGTGNWVLTGANTYTGGTTIKSGTLQLNAGSISLASADATVGNANGDTGTLLIGSNGTVTSNNGFIGENAGSSGSVTVAGASSNWTNTNGLFVGDNGTGTLSISQGGAVSVSGGSGTVALGSATTGVGTLNIGAKSSDAAVSAGILNAATVATGSGTGTVQFNTTATAASPYYFTTTGDSSGAAVALAGPTLVINTAGFNVLTGANTYSGSTTIAGGTLSVSSLADGGAANVSGIGSSTNAAANLVLSGGTLQYTGSGASTDRLFSIGTGAGGTIDASGTGAISFTNTGSMGFVSSGARTLTLTGTNTGNNTLAAVVGDNGSGATALAKSGAGTWVLSSANTYTGGTTINNGTLADGTANAFSPNSPVSLNSGALLNMNFNEAISGLDSLTNGSGIATIANAVTLAINNAGSDTFSGVIAGRGALLEAGPGTETLTGANTYTGGTTIDGGTLAIGADDNLGAVPGSASPGQLSLDGGILRTLSTFTLASNRGINLGSGGGSFSTDSGTTTNYSGIIAGPGALNKLGDGTLALSGANTYAGGTAINQGTLLVGNNSALGSGSVALSGGQLSVKSGVTLSNSIDFGSNGATLAGNGTFGSPITVGSKIILSPGDSPGTLTFTSGLTFDQGGEYDWQIQSVAGTPGQSWDFVSVTGQLNITASSESQFTIKIFSLNSVGNAGAVSDFNSGNPYAWTIASATGGISNFNSADFAIDIGGFQNSLDGGAFFITAGSNDLMLNFTPVPEPSTYGLMAAGLVVLLWRRRRNLRG